MPLHLECLQFNQQTQQCEVQAWVEHKTFMDSLPNVEQAHAFGVTMLLLCAGIIAAGLANPPRGNTDE